MDASLRAFSTVCLGLLMSASLATPYTSRAGTEAEWMDGERRKEKLGLDRCPGFELLGYPKLEGKVRKKKLQRN